MADSLWTVAGLGWVLNLWCPQQALLYNKETGIKRLYYWAIKWIVWQDGDLNSSWSHCKIYIWKRIHPCVRGVSCVSVSQSAPRTSLLHGPGSSGALGYWRHSLCSDRNAMGHYHPSTQLWTRFLQELPQSSYISLPLAIDFLCRPCNNKSGMVFYSSPGLREHGKQHEGVDVGHLACFIHKLSSLLLYEASITQVQVWGGKYFLRVWTSEIVH